MATAGQKNIYRNIHMNIYMSILMNIYMNIVKNIHMSILIAKAELSLAQLRPACCFDNGWSQKINFEF